MIIVLCQSISERAVSSVLPLKSLTPARATAADRKASRLPPRARLSPAARTRRRLTRRRKKERKKRRRRKRRKKVRR